ncbi:hypothetical protein U1Q18_044590, partial [Sarracenia purpurea var. burkii]
YRTIGHATEKCKTNKQTKGNEGWIQVGKGKGKAPIHQASPSAEPCEGNVPTKVAELNKEAQEAPQASPSTVPCEGNVPTKEAEINKEVQEVPTLETIKSLEKEAQTVTYEQSTTQSDSEEEAQEVFDAEIITDDFDSPVVSSKGPPKKDQPEKPSEQEIQ